MKSRLYYIFILHQTTTLTSLTNTLLKLYYIFILHQTTTIHWLIYYQRSCIISSFYIKPQHTNITHCWSSVVLYLHSTSNHNLPDNKFWMNLLYYIFILHQTTTHAAHIVNIIALYYIFILHQTTTSNTQYQLPRTLYYIFILHQTTTYTTYITDIQPFENHIG